MLKMKFGRLNFLAYVVMPVLCLSAGCQPGIVAVLATPTSAETKIPPEYDLTLQKDKKILVLVEQPAHLIAHPNLRYFITDTAYKLLKDRAKIDPLLFIDYDKLADFRSSNLDYSLISPDKVGSALGADLVLLIVINDCRVAPVGETNYFGGSLDAQAQLIDAATGEKLWPAMENARAIKVGFESERRGADAAALRLAVAAAHCVTRYLYNCPKNQFKISDEAGAVGW